jgi:phage nucleotide-binding protein
MLPVNEKVHRESTSQIKLWIYGEPTIGKTIFANQFPDALFLNTDGNIKYIDSPALPITAAPGKDPWEVFVDAIQELTTTQHTYKTVVVDLLEDVFQYCRAFYAKKLKIEHEADLGYGKGYDIIRNAFLIVLRTLMNSGLNVVLVSHEKAVTIKDRIGRELTRFQPAISESVAGKISGMVDITGRVMIKSEEVEGKIIDSRILYLDATKDQVGGNRIPTIKTEYIPLNYTNLLEVYKGEE